MTAPQTEFADAGESPGLALWRATLAWQRRVRAALEPLGLTHVQFVLLTVTWWLEEHDGPPTQSILAARAGTDPMMTSQVARRLESDGLLRREPDAADARVRRLGLTDEGRARLKSALPAVEAVDAEVFGRLDPGARAELTRALGIVASD
jgi:DNA-binding MarR family transcriptional regulator